MRPRSIRVRLLTVIVLTTGISLALACVIFIFFEWRHSLLTEQQAILSTGRIAADASSAVLAFDEASEAQDLLSAFRTEPDVLAAVLFDAHGKLFAEYRSPAATFPLPLAPQADGLVVGNQRLGLFQPVVQGQKRYGTLYLRTDLRDMYGRILRYVWIALLIFLGALAAAFFVGRVLQQKISQPILSLAETARSISQDHNYSVRAQKLESGELELLTNAFNQMLEEIQGAQAQLQAELSERKQAQEALGEQARLLDLTNDAVMVCDLEDRIRYWNRAAEVLYGWRPQEAVGRFKYELLKTEFLKPRQDILAALYRDNRWNGELIQTCRDGSRITVNTRWALDRVEGRSAWILKTDNDITERKRAEHALQESENRMRLAQQVARIGTFEWNIQTGANVWTPELEKMYGLPEDTFTGTQRTWESLVHEEDRAHAMQRVREAIETGTFADEWRVVWPDGTVHWLAGRALVFKDQAGRPLRLLGVNIDITERKRGEEALLQARQKLQQHADELEKTVAERTVKLRETVGELEAFSYSIAHDMRAPLRAMQGFSTMLQEECGQQISPTGRDYLRRIAKSAHRLDNLIQDVLNYSKIVRAEWDVEPVDIMKFVGEIIESYPNLHPPNATVRCEGPAPLVLANPSALTQVISNLLGNAVKFVSPGVKPEVRIWAELTAGDMVRIWFEDNGIGIRKEVHERIFQMFQRINPPGHYEGTGIGLTIVRKAVERMGGKVGLESELGNGSRFWIELKRST